MRLGQRLRRVPYYLDRESRYLWMRALPRERVLQERLAVLYASLNRAGPRLDNCLRSMRAQSLPAASVDLTLVDQGSQPAIEEELRAICARHRARLVLLRDPEPVWHKTWCLNVGLRLAPATARWVLNSDVDMIYAPNFAETVLRAHLAFGPSHVFADWRDLPETAVTETTDVVRDWPRLAGQGEFRGVPGVGAFQSWPRGWLERVGAFDERYRGWGAEDDDILRRSKRAGLRQVRVDRFTALSHQWHPTQSASADDAGERQRYEAQRERNYALLASDETIDRNPDGWGALTPQAEVVEPG